MTVPTVESTARALVESVHAEASTSYDRAHLMAYRLRHAGFTADELAIMADATRVKETTRARCGMSTAPELAPRVMSMQQASRVYCMRPSTIKALWECGHIKGRMVPGRGRTGQELRLFRPSLDAYFGG